MEAAQVWNSCMQRHKQARLTHAKWPGRDVLQQATKGCFALHSQSVQMVVHAFLANVATTRQLRKTHPQLRMKYPWRIKRFYPVSWPAQAVSKEQGRVVLPMGKGRQSLVLPLDLPETSGACTLVWNDGFELHVCVEVPQAQQAHIMSFTGSERGTSSQCPACGHKHKPRNRQWTCKACGFQGHRDLVGSVNMHRLAYGIQVEFPRSFTYLRPSSSRAGTPQRCLSESTGQALLAEQVSSETAHPADVA